MSYKTYLILTFRKTIVGRVFLTLLHMKTPYIAYTFFFKFCWHLLIQTFTLQRPVISMLFKNYSLVEVLYLLVRFNNTKNIVLCCLCLNLLHYISLKPFHIASSSCTWFSLNKYLFEQNLSCWIIWRHICWVRKKLRIWKHSCIY